MSRSQQTPIPNRSARPTQDSMDGIQSTLPSSASTETANEQDSINKALAQDVFIRLNRATSIPELVKCIPASVQPQTKDMLDKIISAFQKLGVATDLKKSWDDKLLTQSYNEVTALNAIKPPVVQLSAEAKKADGELEKITFNSVIVEAKKAALTQMIYIKQKEIDALHTFCKSTNVISSLTAIWKADFEKSLASPEVLAILTDRDIIQRVVTLGISFGEGMLQRVLIQRQKRKEAKTEADTQMTDVGSVEQQKSLMALVNQQLARRDQSKRDKKLSGKGKRRIQVVFVHHTVARLPS
ncbi:hypothetical protein FH972_020948 [Carpinus fangiana]|uniref:Uncharacterized protein n=1 Tax=Carpinus fangiana TaxID=176857 RepID=A0A5N6KQ01_9ROSI|nr:hypothetical protein FH972_020948 [Carpinus fangiana]